MSSYFMTEEERIQADDMFQRCGNVFVYGTLKKGRGNNHILGQSTLIGEAVTVEKFALGDGGVPYAFPADKVPKDYQEALLHPVRGELYRMDNVATAAKLDALEGFPEYYYRRIIDVKVDDSITFPAWIYTIEDFSYAYWCDAAQFNKGEWSWV